MRKALLILAVLISKYTIYAQQPVHWDYSLKKINDSSGELHLTATIDTGWHIYSQVQPGRTISKPTKIEIAQNPLIKLEGKVEEKGNLDKNLEKTLGIVQNRYAGTVDFIQLIVTRSKVKMRISG